MDKHDDSYPVAPVADRRPHHVSHHGIELHDDYAWLRAENWQEVMRTPEVLAEDIRAYLEAENAYTETVMQDTEELQQTLYEEMKGRIKQDDSSVPTPDGPWSYFSRFVTGGEYPLICREPRQGGTAQTILDGNQMAEGLEYFAIGGASHSHDHQLIAYGVDDRGSEYYTIRIRDLDNGADPDDVLTDTGGGAVWAYDNQTLFYTKLDDNHRPCAVYRHKLATPQSDDVLVYREDNPGFFVGVGATQSNDYIVISSSDHETSECYLIDSRAPDNEPRLVEAREEGHEYSIDHHGDRLIIHTNTDGAEDFKIMTAPIDAPGRDQWRDLVTHRVGRLILDATPLQRHLVWIERENGLPRIVIRPWSGVGEHAISFEEDAYSLGLSIGYEFDTDQIRFSYSSMTTPSEVYDYDMETRERVLRKRQEVPSGHDPKDYVTRRLFAPAHDGEEIPVTLLYRAGTALDGSAPLLLYGYGAYGIAMPAGFSTGRLSLVDRGFIYAIAHIRGGKEKGYRWYRDGKREKKINTFKDFIATGEHLINQGLTRRGQIIAHGGSAGGLLVGGVANMAPDLFRAIIAEVPFVDTLTTMLDDSLPLTPMEWPEWGNPIASKLDFEAIAAYSPYDNVAAQHYPHILAVGGLTDPRVTYWEPAKWTAKLRAVGTGDNLILLRTNMGAGHGGASGRFERLHEVALCYAFALKVSP